MIYINGRKASEKDLQRLRQDLYNGKAILIKAVTTKKGAMALTVGA